MPSAKSLGPGKWRNFLFFPPLSPTSEEDCRSTHHMFLLWLWGHCYALLPVISSLFHIRCFQTPASQQPARSLHCWGWPTRTEWNIYSDSSEDLILCLVQIKTVIRPLWICTRILSALALRNHLWPFKVIKSSPKQTHNPRIYASLGIGHLISKLHRRVGPWTFFWTINYSEKIITLTQGLFLLPLNTVPGKMNPWSLTGVCKYSCNTNNFRASMLGKVQSSKNN